MTYPKRESQDLGATLPEASRGGRFYPVVLIAAGAALRLHGFQTFPLEQDELYTRTESKLLFDSPLVPGIGARPLYYLLQHLFTPLLPADPAIALRIFPFVFAVLGLWSVWVLGRSFGGRWTASVALLIAVFSPWTLYIATMGRYWSLILLLAALYLRALKVAMEREQRGSHLVVSALFVLGTLTHPTFLFYAAGAALGALLVNASGRFRVPLPSRGSLIFCWIPAALILMTYALVLWVMGEGVEVRNQGSRAWSATLRLYPAIAQWMTPTLLAAGGLGALILAAGEDRHRRRWGMAMIGGTLGSLLLLGIAAGRTSVYADYAVAVLPAIFVGCGLLVEHVAGGSRHGLFLPRVGVTAVLLAGILPSAVSHWFDGTRFDYRPGLRFAEASAPARTMVTWPIIVQREYAPRLNGVELRPNRERLDSVLQANDTVWLQLSLQRYGIVKDQGRTIASWAAAHCRLKHVHEPPRFDYRRYRVETHACFRQAE